jgi:hypothetical protein
MISEVLNVRIREYSPADAMEQENVLQELMQYYVLAALSRSGMFSEAVFHGGTCLRIVQRFLPAGEQAGLRLWSREFFLDRLERVRLALLGE